MHPACVHQFHIRARAYAALGDDQAPGRDARQQLQRGLEPRFESAQVAVVDADEWGGERERRSGSTASSAQATAATTPRCPAHVLRADRTPKRTTKPKNYLKKPKEDLHVFHRSCTFIAYIVP